MYGNRYTIRGRGKQLRGISPQGVSRGNAFVRMERLLRQLQFTDRLTVAVQNGRVLKSGYEEGLFPPAHDSVGCAEHSPVSL
jgi:hypothetical protein